MKKKYIKIQDSPNLDEVMDIIMEIGIKLYECNNKIIYSVPYSQKKLWYITSAFVGDDINAAFGSVFERGYELVRSGGRVD